MNKPDMRRTTGPNRGKPAARLRSVSILLILCLAAAGLVLNPVVTKYVFGLSNGWVLFPLAFNMMAAAVMASAALNLWTRRVAFGVAAVVGAIAVVPAMFFVELAIYYYILELRPDPVVRASMQMNVSKPVDGLGWGLVPNGIARHVLLDNFDVNYTFDEGGRKRIAQNASTRRTLHVFGDSFAFGFGVGNDESALALLAARLNAEMNVLNYAVPGYGLEQMVLRLERNLDEIRDGDIVLFLPIAEDIWRSMIYRPEPCGTFYRLERTGTFPMWSGDGWIDADLARECSYVLDHLLHQSKLVFGPLWVAYSRAATIAPLLRNADVLLRMARGAAEGRGADFAAALIATPDECMAGAYEVDWSPLNAVVTPLIDACPNDAEQALTYRFPSDRHLSEAGNVWLAETLLTYLQDGGWL